MGQNQITLTSKLYDKVLLNIYISAVTTGKNPTILVTYTIAVPFIKHFTPGSGPEVGMRGQELPYSI